MTGKWTVVEGAADVGLCLAIIPSNSDCEIMAVCLISPIASITDNDRSNAHLIAAAPELLEALEVFADLLGYEDPINSDDKVTVISGPTTDYSIQGRHILSARAIIAKARNTSTLHIETL